MLLNAYVDEQYFSSNKEGYLPTKNRRVSMPGTLKYPDIKALVHERHRKCRPGGGGGRGGGCVRKWCEKMYYQLQLL